MNNIKYILLIIATTIISAKEIVVITDISVEPTKNGYSIIDSQLMHLLEFNFENNTYLKFGDKVTMAYIDNSAENASAYFPEPTFSLSEDKFEEYDNHLDNYYAMAGEYIDSMLTVPKQKIQVDHSTEIIDADKLQDIIFAIDGSSSMNSFINDAILSKDNIISSAGLRGYKTIKSQGNQLSHLLKDIKPTTIPKQLILYTDGIDDTDENIKLINKIKKSGYTVYPVVLSKKWDEMYLSKLSSKPNSLYTTQEALNKIKNATYQTSKAVENISFSSYPNLPIIESINEISKHSFSSTNTKKDIYIISSMMQNSENMSFEKYITEKIDVNVDYFVSFYEDIGMLPNLNGQNINILRINMGLFKNNNQIKIIDKFWKKFFKRCGAANVHISASNFDLRR
jgi:hypothetical protein